MKKGSLKGIFRGGGHDRAAKGKRGKKRSGEVATASSEDIKMHLEKRSTEEGEKRSDWGYRRGGARPQAAGKALEEGPNAQFPARNRKTGTYFRERGEKMMKELSAATHKKLRTKVGGGKKKKDMKE